MITRARVPARASTGAPRRGRHRRRPPPHSNQPYFTTWLTQQLVDRYGPGARLRRRAEVTTTLDPELRRRPSRRSPAGSRGVGPSASLVAIDNKTGEVKAMVGGSDYQADAVQPRDQRPPPAGLLVQAVHPRARARADGISPDTTFASQPRSSPSRSSGEKFEVNNYDDSYYGRRVAADRDDELRQLGVRRARPEGRHPADRADGQPMGIRTPISTNPAMTLGGLSEGVTPLEMAYAYSTIANKRRAQCRARSAPGDDGPGRHRGVKGGGHRRSRTSAARARLLRRRWRRDRPADARGRRLQRHRQGGPDRRVRGRQDRHDRELRRRLVRRLQQAT